MKPAAQEKPHTTAEYPRVYPLFWGWKVFIACMLPLAGLYFVSCVVIYAIRPEWAGLFLIAFSFFFLLFWVWGFARMWFIKITLHADKIEVCGFSSTRSLRREQIYGRRKVRPVKSLRTMTALIPLKSENEKPLYLPSTASDAVLESWVSSLRNIDV